MNAVRILSETQDTVTLSRGDWAQLLSELEDAEDRATVVDRRRPLRSPVRGGIL